MALAERFFAAPEQSCPFCPKFPIILVFSKTRHAREVIGMQQRGSKYDQKIKDEALGARGERRLDHKCRVPAAHSEIDACGLGAHENESTRTAWRTAGNPPQADRRCEKIETRCCVRSTARPRPPRRTPGPINDGLAVLEKAARDGVISLSEAEVASLRNVVTDYTGVGLRELAGTMKDVAARQETLEQHLGEKDGTGVQITFVEGAEELAE